MAVYLTGEYAAQIGYFTSRHPNGSCRDMYFSVLSNGYDFSFHSSSLLYSAPIELLYLTQFIRECRHVPTFLFVGDFGVNLRGANIRVSEHLGKGFDGNAVGQADFRRHSMAAGMPRNLLFNTAESDDFLNVLTSSYIRRNGQKQVVFCHTIVFIDNLLQNILEYDIGLHTRLLSHGHNPEFPIKGSLKVVLGQVLHDGKGQTLKQQKTYKSRTSSIDLRRNFKSNSLRISSLVR